MRSRVWSVSTLALLVVTTSSCHSNKTTTHARRAAATSSTAALPAALSRFDIGRLDTTELPNAAVHLAGFLSDGSHLYARVVGKNGPVRLVRLDPHTGTIVASYDIREPPPHTPYTAATAQAFQLTDSGIVSLDGDRAEVRILDPVTLAVRHVEKLPADARTDIPTSVYIHGPLWIGHQLWASDQIVGKNTLMGVTRVVPLAGAPETRRVPPCGSKGGVQPTPQLLVINLECVDQIAIVNLRTNAVYTYPSLLSRVDVTILNGQVWAHWKNLGLVARVDAVHRTLTAVDLNVDGPVLSSVLGVEYADGFVWASGIPADAELPPILFKIDPRTVSVVARVWSPPYAAFVNGVGYVIDSNGRLATFAESAIHGGAPTYVARPAIHAPVAHQATNAAERAVMRDFSLVFDYTRSNAAVAQYVEAKKSALVLREKLTKLARQLYANVHVVITDVAVQGDMASVSYSFALGKTAAFVPLSAELTRASGRWVVSADSICHLADVAGLGNC